MSLLAKFVLLEMCAYIATYSPGHFRREIDEAQQKFGLQCLKTIASSKNSCSNLLISPSSISSALAMVVVGARGETLDELVSALQLPDMSVVNITRGFRGVRRSIEKRIRSRATRVSMADRMFLAYDVSLGFRQSTWFHRFFQLEPTRLDFSHATGAAHVINGEVARLTRGQIQEIVSSDSLDSQTKMVLISVIYLKAKWKYNFHPLLTSDERFSTPEGVKQVPMMHTEDRFRHGRFDRLNSRILLLPYVDSALNMLIVLPDDSVSTDKVIDLLTDVRVKDLLTAVKRSDQLEVHLPRFTLKLTYQMKDTLRKMGINRVFDQETADLGFSSDEHLAIDSFQHSAVMTVDEEGTTASAATGVVMTPRMGYRTKPFIVNRPFLLMLVDERRGTLLFVGRVNDPTRTESCGQ